jgi:hypothetical protein
VRFLVLGERASEEDGRKYRRRERVKNHPPEERGRGRETVAQNLRDHQSEHQGRQQGHTDPHSLAHPFPQSDPTVEHDRDHAKRDHHEEEADSVGQRPQVRVLTAELEPGVEEIPSPTSPAIGSIEDSVPRLFPARAT